MSVYCEQCTNCVQCFGCYKCDSLINSENCSKCNNGKSLFLCTRCNNCQYCICLTGVDNLKYAINGNLYYAFLQDEIITDENFIENYNKDNTINKVFTNKRDYLKVLNFMFIDEETGDFMGMPCTDSYGTQFKPMSIYSYHLEKIFEFADTHEKTLTEDEQKEYKELVQYSNSWSVDKEHPFIRADFKI